MLHSQVYSTMVDGPQYTGLLHVRQIVYSGLYGGRYGVISHIDGEQNPASIRDHGGIMVSGGRAHVRVVFENGTISTVPEAIIRGVQWRIGPASALVSEQALTDLLLNAEKVKTEKEQATKDQAAADAKETAELPARFPFLVPMSATPDKSRWSAGAANIRRHLAQEFPGVSFKVKSESYSGGCSIRAEWTDGPTREEVQKVTELYKEGDFDGMQDLYEYNRSVFPEVFGGAKYVFANRRISNDAFVSVATDMGYPDACNNDKTGGFDGVSYETGEMIRRETWRRSFYTKPDPAPEKPAENPPTLEAPPANPAPSVEFGEYKGHPTITLPTGYKGFTFGLSKARAILDNYEAIKAWVESQED